MDSTQEMARSTLMGRLFLSRKLEIGQHALSYWEMNAVNAWPTMELLPIWSPTLLGSYMKEMCQLQKMLTFGQELAASHHSLEPLWQMLIREDIGPFLLSPQFTSLCLDKAAIMSEAEIKGGDFSDPWRLCTMTQVEELKILIRMFPIWATGIVFSTVHAQMSTIFVEQGMLMDKTIGSFNIPPASMTTIDVISVLFGVPIYDRIIVPIARKFTGRERGFSELQRMGIGLFISMLSMTAAALLEIKRLQLVKELGLVGDAVAVPLSILWQIPQYMLIGTAEIFTYIGQLEFFYEQSPDAMRSLCSALALLAASLGSYLSSFILSMVTYLTTTGGKTGWVPDNLNTGHLDYLFWLLAGLSFFNLLIYTVCAKRYKEKKAS